MRFFMPSAESLPLSPEKTDSSRNLGGRAAWGRVCGRAKLLAGTLRCLHLLLGVFDKLVARPTVGALPQTPQGTLSLDPARGRRKGTKSPLDPFSRLSWSHFHAPSACSFLVLRLSPYLLPKLSVKNQKTCLQNAADCAKMPKHPHFSEDSARWRPCFLS